MRSGITRRWLCGSLLITVLLVLLAETMFLYNYTRSYYNSVQQTMYRRFSSVSGQLKMYTGDTVQSTAATRSVALRRMVEQFADKDKYEFMLLDSYGGVIASSSGTNADGIVTGIDFEQAQEASDGLGVAVYRTQSGELVMAACYLVPYAAEDVAAMRLVTSLTLVGAQIKNAIAVSVVIAAVILAFTVMSGLYFIRSIVVPLGQVERTAASIARGELDVRLPVTVPSLTSCARRSPPSGAGWRPCAHWTTRQTRTTARALRSSTMRRAACTTWWKSCWISAVCRTAASVWTAARWTLWQS